MKVSLRGTCSVLLKENCLWPLSAGSCDLLGLCFQVRAKVAVVQASGETQSLGGAPFALPAVPSLRHTALRKPGVPSPSHSWSLCSLCRNGLCCHSYLPHTGCDLQ